MFALKKKNSLAVFTGCSNIKKYNIILLKLFLFKFQILVRIVFFCSLVSPSNNAKNTQMLQRVKRVKNQVLKASVKCN